MSQLTTYAMPAGRILIALIFLLSGLNKIGGYEMTAGWMVSMGVPGWLLPLVIITEVVGAAFIIAGFQTRYAALALAGFSILSALIFHTNFGDQNEMIHFMKNLAIAGGFLFLVANGPGAVSVDNRNA